MKIISWNVNGLRSVYSKGLLEFIKKEKPDIVCLQEVKATPDKVEDLGLNSIKGYQAHWHPAEKPGYSGVLTYSRVAPDSLVRGLGEPSIDREGRVLQTQFGEFMLLNCYFPNSQREHTRLPYKLQFCRAVHKHVKRLRRQGQHVLLCGDFNIAHREIDLRNPSSNRDNAGFLPDERAWMEEFLSDGMCDVFRHFEPGPEHYTWWSYRPGVREKNIGWRIDYFVADQAFMGQIKSMRHRPEIQGSDHCPIILQI